MAAPVPAEIKRDGGALPNQPGLFNIGEGVGS